MIPRAIVITGATGGLGQALVAAYATPGRALLLIGRHPERLEAARARAEAAGATVETARLSVTDSAALTAAIAQFDAAHAIDLMLVNAGVKTGNTAGHEPPDQTARVLAVNLHAAMACAQAVLPGMQARGRGQIALVASMAALSPHADLLSYSASKAGLRAYGIALRRTLRGSGITVSVITPGFMDTPMTDRQKGPTPFLISARTAAETIRRGLLAERAMITFPWQLALLIRLENLLPMALSDAIDARFRAVIAPDDDERRG